jgi:hypothetical protein
VHSKSYDCTHSTTDTTAHTHTSAHLINHADTNHAYTIGTHSDITPAHTHADHDATECGTSALCGVMVGMQ